MGDAEVGAHGIIMIIAFLFMTQLAEVIAWWATNKVCMYVYAHERELSPLLSPFIRLHISLHSNHFPPHFYLIY